MIIFGGPGGCVYHYACLSSVPHTVSSHMRTAALRATLLIMLGIAHLAIIFVFPIQTRNDGQTRRKEESNAKHYCPGGAS